MKVRFTHEILGSDFNFEATFVHFAGSLRGSRRQIDDGLEELSSIVVMDGAWHPAHNVSMDDLSNIYIRTGERMVSLKAVLTDRAFDELTTIQDADGFPDKVRSSNRL
jgi:hypothetical protein